MLGVFSATAMNQIIVGALIFALIILSYHFFYGDTTEEDTYKPLIVIGISFLFIFLFITNC